MERTRYARLITMKTKRGSGRKFAETFEKEVVPTAVKLSGLRRLYLLRPVGRSDEFVAISLWDDEKHAKNYVRSGQDKRYLARLAGLQKGRERVEQFHVEIHATGESVQTDNRS